MTREEKKKELTDLFFNSALTFGEVIDEAFEFADEHPQDWISVEDEKPKDGQWVLVCNAEYLPLAFVTQFVFDGDDLTIRLYSDGKCIANLPATHWFPISQPPKKGD